MLIAFDFDGTLMDTLRDLAEAASDLAESYGGRRLTEDQTAAMIGDGAPVFVQRILATVGIDVPPPESVPRYLAFYERRVDDHTAPYDGVPELLQALAPHHHVALLTNKPEASARALIARTGIGQWLGHMVFGDGPLARKPDPEGLRWLMAATSTSPDQTMMVGDSVMDLEAGRAAGTRVCLARYGFGFPRIPTARIQPGDLIIDRPLELAERLGIVPASGRADG